MNTPTPTPRTQASLGGYEHLNPNIIAEFEKLEIELIEARTIQSRLCDERDAATTKSLKLERELAEARKACVEIDLSHRKLEAQLSAMTKDRDQWREQAEAWRFLYGKQCKRLNEAKAAFDKLKEGGR